MFTVLDRNVHSKRAPLKLRVAGQDLHGYPIPPPCRVPQGKVGINCSSLTVGCLTHRGTVGHFVKRARWGSGTRGGRAVGAPQTAKCLHQTPFQTRARGMQQCNRATQRVSPQFWASDGHSNHSAANRAALTAVAWVRILRRALAAHPLPWATSLGPAVKFDLYITSRAPGGGGGEGGVPEKGL